MLYPCKSFLMFFTSAGRAGARAPVPGGHLSKSRGRRGGRTQLLALAGNVLHIKLSNKTTIQMTNVNVFAPAKHWCVFRPFRSLFSTNLAAVTTTHAGEPWLREAGWWRLLTVWTGSEMINSSVHFVFRCVHLVITLTWISKTCCYHSTGGVDLFQCF